jgi:(2Fe-2S) ferredoxin
MDMCDEGPVIAVQPDDFFYGQMTVQRVPAIVKALAEGSKVREFVVQTASLAGSNKDR